MAAIALSTSLSLSTSTLKLTFTKLFATTLYPTLGTDSLSLRPEPRLNTCTAPTAPTAWFIVTSPFTPLSTTLPSTLYAITALQHSAAPLTLHQEYTLTISLQFITATASKLLISLSIPPITLRYLKPSASITMFFAEI